MNDKNKEDVLDYLMTNPDFREWVNSPSEERTQYWNKWIAYNSDRAEAVEFAKRAIQGLKFKEELLSDERLESILNKVISEESSIQLPQAKRTNKFQWGVAASIVIILGVAALFSSKFFVKSKKKELTYRTVSNPEGQKSRLKLPDGTLINLNAGSSIRFLQSNTAQGERVVELSGEAYFQVAKDKLRPFIVQSGGLSLKVLGTSFNCRSFPWQEEIVVALEEGSLQVEANNEVFKINPGDRAVYDKTAIAMTIDQFDIVAEMGWKDGVLRFDNTTFNQFIKRLENWYGVQIQIEGSPADSWKVNGSFDNASLEEVLLGLKFTYNLEYHIIGKSVRLIL